MAYKYTGLLGEPPADPFPRIDDPSYDPFDPDSQKMVVARASAQLSERIEALFNDCNVELADPAGWMKVSLTLAERHIRAFQGNAAKRGRKKTVDDSLVLEMGALIKEGHSIKNAATIVLKRRDVTDKKQIAALEIHFHRTRDEWKMDHELFQRWAQQNAERKR